MRVEAASRSCGLTACQAPSACQLYSTIPSVGSPSTSVREQTFAPHGRGNSGTEQRTTLRVAEGRELVLEPQTDLPRAWEITSSKCWRLGMGAWAQSGCFLKVCPQCLGVTSIHTADGIVPSLCPRLFAGWGAGRSELGHFRGDSGRWNPRGGRGWSGLWGAHGPGSAFSSRTAPIPGAPWSYRCSGFSYQAKPAPPPAGGSSRPGRPRGPAEARAGQAAEPGRPLPMGAGRTRL